MDKEDVFGSTIRVVYSTAEQGSTKKGKKSQTVESTESSAMSPKPSPLQKDRGSSDVTNRKSSKPENKVNPKPSDDTPESSDSTEENASWLASLHNFTVLDQQQGEIDLLVTNLDETVNNKELKKKLESVFQEHCEVWCMLLITDCFVQSLFVLGKIYQTKGVTTILNNKKR